MVVVWSCYFILVNIIAFALMGIDKKKAIAGKWRIRESVFFILSLIGGGIFAYVGMFTFRHKTKHASFLLGIPVCAVIGLAVIILGYLLIFKII